jgi:60 kDa SS-A/Ro ribonucleoprotein
MRSAETDDQMSYLSSALEPATQLERSHPSQVQNSAGGYTFAVDDWARLRRFLVLGAAGGTYYASERKLVRDNAAVVSRLAAGDGVRLVGEIAALSESGVAPKNDPAILALAVAARTGDDATRAAAYKALPRVCRIGTHLYHFVEFANEIGGWGRGFKRAVASWFLDRDAESLAYQLVKYQQRDGWSARDLLRLSHAVPTSQGHDALFSWAVSGFDGAAAAGKSDTLPPIIAAVEELKVTKDPARVCRLVHDYRIPREAIPTEWLTRADVWEAMLPALGMTALVRNLATLTRVGVIAPGSANNATIAARLTDAEALKGARVHPVQMLAALCTYARGHGERGGSTWEPVQSIVDALDAGFYASFAAVAPTGRATLIALDVSGSMHCGVVAGSPGLTPAMASAAMAMVTAAVEPNYHVVGFSGGMRDLPISPGMRMPDVLRVISGLPFDRTDCSLPFVWAKENRNRFESFAVYTDNETYAGRTHPHAALQAYRSATGIKAKSAVIGMESTGFTIADPSDAGMMDFVGFDSSVPQVMADFFS